MYRIFQDEDGRRMGSFVDMLASREEAEIFAEGREGEHEVVGLWTREISEEDGDLWGSSCSIGKAASSRWAILGKVSGRTTGVCDGTR